MAIASYQYDPYGQRIRKTVHRTLNTDGSWQLLTAPNSFSYFYRDEGLSAQYQSAGQDITSPKQIAQYGWLPNGVWGTSPVWINTTKRTTTTVNVNGSNQIETTISPPDYYYYQNDHLGTPQQLTDSAGNIVWQQKSTAFGEVQITIGDSSNETNHTSNTTTTGAIANPFRFAGQYYDQETNTNYNYHRQYRMAGGGYTQTDPIGLAGGLNSYAYVGGNPIGLIDPEGLQAVPKPTIPSPTSSPTTPQAPNTPAANDPVYGPNIGWFARATPFLMALTLSGDTPQKDRMPNPPAAPAPKPEPSPNSDQGRCFFIREVYWGGPCKTCVYKCTNWGAPVTYPQAVGKACPSIKSTGYVNTNEIDAKCRPPLECK